MTIDDHIEVLKSYHHGFTGCAGNLQDSIDVAVDIMHKYQKIEQIIKTAGIFAFDVPEIRRIANVCTMQKADKEQEDEKESLDRNS